MATTWLQAQKKVDLVDIADRVGLKDYQDMLKADLAQALDKFMRSNSTRLSKDSSLSEYYDRLNPSPVKTVATKTPKASGGRRATKAKEEIEAETALTRTPKNKLLAAASVPLPPSPAVVVSHIDRQAAKMRTSLNKALRRAGLYDAADRARDRISTTSSIETTVLLLELLSLRRELLPTRAIAAIPANDALGTPAVPVNVPDVFVFLTADYWAAFALWFFASVGVPLLAAYFFNPSLKARAGASHTRARPAQQYDMVTFNVVKALVAWLLYRQDAALFGYPSDDLKVRILSGLPAGYHGILVGAAVGGVVSIYEAVLRK